MLFYRLFAVIQCVVVIGFSSSHAFSIWSFNGFASFQFTCFSRYCWPFPCCPVSWSVITEDVKIVCDDDIIPDSTEAASSTETVTPTIVVDVVETNFSETTLKSLEYREGSTISEETSTITEDTSTNTEEISTTTENQTPTRVNYVIFAEETTSTTSDITTENEDPPTTTEQLSTTTEVDVLTTEEVVITTKEVVITTEEVVITTEEPVISTIITEAITTPKTTSVNTTGVKKTTPEMCSHFTTMKPTMTCKESKYRRLDGTCNNLNKGLKGSSRTRYKRHAPPFYDDGVHHPRELASEGGLLLPSRNIITKVNVADQTPVNNTVNLMYIVWGQFVAYDMVRTYWKEYDERPLDCCNNEYDITNPRCYPIFITKDDPFYSKHNLTCSNFVRSYAEPVPEGYKEQINSATSFIDCSQIYGSSLDEADVLRTFKEGKLRLSTNRVGSEILPLMFDAQCKGITKFPVCFLAGDNRANQHGALTLLYVTFVREHNRICSELQRQNPNWDDETLYQEARRIIIAITQHITFNEFIPILLNKKMIEKHLLKPTEKSEYFYGYDSNIDPSISQEFATAAFRGGQAKVTNSWIYTDSKHYAFHDTYNPAVGFMRGDDFAQDLRKRLTVKPSLKIPNFFSEELTEHLFEVFPSKYGEDLASINIQRGRDHGIAPYVIVRKYLNYSVPETFDDLKSMMDIEIINRLKSAYESVKDIDLFVGGYLEKPLSDGQLGETFQEIIADQFKRSKRGDKYWYELGNSSSSFTQEQLRQIKKSTLSRLLCNQGEPATRLAMRMPCAKNPLIKCDDLPTMNFSPWREQRFPWNRPTLSRNVSHE